MMKSVLVRANISREKLSYRLSPSEEFSGHWQIAIGALAIETQNALNLTAYLTCNVAIGKRLNNSYESVDFEMPLTTFSVSTSEGNLKKLYRFSLNWFEMNVNSNEIIFTLTDIFSEANISTNCSIILHVFFQKI